MIVEKLRIFFLGLRTFSRRTREESAAPYLREGKPKRYGLVISDKAPIYSDYRIITKITFFFDESGVFHYQKGVGRLGVDVDTMLVVWVDSVLAMYRGFYKPKNSKERLPYDIFTAVRLGHCRFSGEASTTDVKYFSEILTTRPEIKSKYLKGVEQ